MYVKEILMSYYSKFVQQLRKLFAKEKGKKLKHWMPLQQFLPFRENAAVEVGIAQKWFFCFERPF